MQISTKPRSALTYFPSDLQGDFSSEETAILESIHRKVGALDSLNEVMNLVFDSTRAICPCDRIGVAFLEEDGRQLVCKWARTLYKPVELGVGYGLDIGEGSLRRVIDEGHPRIINDLQSYLRRHPRSESTRLLVREGVRSSLTCPLKVNGRNVGVMFRSSRKSFAYSAHQLSLHLAIEERLSQVVANTYRVERLRAAKRSYTEILGFVSHELKNPLTTMINDAWALNSGAAGTLTSEQKERTGRIQTKANHLADLIRQYLDLALLDEDGLKPQTVGASDFLAAVIEPVTKTFRPQLERRGMELALLSDQRDLKVACDPDMMKIVISNLLGNAIKYGLDGGEVRIRWQGAGDLLRVSVFNTGPGFSQQQRSRLFRRFSRLKSAEPPEQPGTGLGLYNVRRIISLHRGRVFADSSPGRWAEFSFEIPLSTPPEGAFHGDAQALPGATAEEVSEQTESLRHAVEQALGDDDRSRHTGDPEAYQPTGPRPSPDGVPADDHGDTDQPVGGHPAVSGEEHDTPITLKPRVLAIDDDPDISRAVALRLGLYGIDVVCSFNGTQGYWMGLDCKPDVIITDLTMPDSEGKHSFLQFKQHPHTENTPIIVLTGHTDPALKRQMLESGVSAYCTKPIDWHLLLEELHRHIDFPREPPDAVEEPVLGTASR